MFHLLKQQNATANVSQRYKELKNAVIKTSDSITNENVTAS
jgi:hypothetical protein